MEINKNINYFNEINLFNVSVLSSVNNKINKFRGIRNYRTKSNNSNFNFEIDPYLSDITDKDYLINREKAVKEFKKNIRVVI